jgi:branched-chain amino acid aminotransferase
MSEYVAYLNGEFIPESECKLHVAERGIQRGDLVFDAERTFDGAVFRLRDHLERIYRSLKYMRIDPGMTIDEMEELTLEVVRRNDPLRAQAHDHWVNQIVTRGRGVKVTDDVPPTVCIRVYPIIFSQYARFYKTGAPVIFPRTRAYPPQSLDPKVKHYSRMNFSQAELEAADLDPDAYPVLLDLEGNLAEGTGANFFIVTNGVLRTPGDRDILQGISRMTVLELADQLGIPTVEEDLQPYDAYTADEAFLTTSSYCVLPVARIDQRPVGQEVPGPIVKRLWAAWSERAGMDIVDQALRAAGE